MRVRAIGQLGLKFGQKLDSWVHFAKQCIWVYFWWFFMSFKSCRRLPINGDLFWSCEEPHERDCMWVQGGLLRHGFKRYFDTWLPQPMFPWGTITRFKEKSQCRGPRGINCIMLTEECQGSKTNQIDYVSDNTDKRNAAKLDSLHTPHPPALERSPEKVAVSNQIKTGNFLHCDHEFNFWVCFTENFVTFFFSRSSIFKNYRSERHPYWHRTCTWNWAAAQKIFIAKVVNIF